MGSLPAILWPKTRDALKKHWKVAIVVFTVLVAFGAGRYATPTKVVTKTETKEHVVYQDRVVTKTVEVEKKNTDAQVQRHVQKTVTKKPDGTVTETETVDTDTHKDTQTQESATQVVYRDRIVYRDRDTTTEKTVTKDAPRWLVSAGAGIDFSHPLGGVAWDLSLQYRILGPIWVGGWAVVGAPDVKGGVNVGLSF